MKMHHQPFFRLNQLVNLKPIVDRRGFKNVKKAPGDLDSRTTWDETESLDMFKMLGLSRIFNITLLRLIIYIQNRLRLPRLSIVWLRPSFEILDQLSNACRDHRFENPREGVSSDFLPNLGQCFLDNIAIRSPGGFP